jgi:hypothetical protein
MDLLRLQSKSESGRQSRRRDSLKGRQGDDLFVRCAKCTNRAAFPRGEPADSDLLQQKISDVELRSHDFPCAASLAAWFGGPRKIQAKPTAMPPPTIGPAT